MCDRVQEVCSCGGARMSKERPVIVGPVDGNAFVILGRARRACKQAGWSKEEIEDLIARATAGDYDQLLATLMEEIDFDL